MGCSLGGGGAAVLQGWGRPHTSMRVHCWAHARPAVTQSVCCLGLPGVHSTWFCIATRPCCDEQGTACCVPDALGLFEWVVAVVAGVCGCCLMHRYNPEWHRAHMGCNCCGGLMLSALLCSSLGTHHFVPLLKRGPVRSLCLPAACLGSVSSTIIVMMCVLRCAGFATCVMCSNFAVTASTRPPHGQSLWTRAPPVFVR